MKRKLKSKKLFFKLKYSSNNTNEIIPVFNDESEYNAEYEKYYAVMVISDVKRHIMDELIDEINTIINTI